MTIQGKIFTLNYPTPKVAELVIRKKKGERFYFICFIAFSNVIYEIKNLGIEKRDKVSIVYNLSSKKYTTKNGTDRWSTSAIIDGIELIEKDIVKQTEFIFVDSETGEIIENVDNTSNL